MQLVCAKEMLCHLLLKTLNYVYKKNSGLLIDDVVFILLLFADDMAI